MRRNVTTFKNLQTSNRPSWNPNQDVGPSQSQYQYLQAKTRRSHTEPTPSTSDVGKQTTTSPPLQQATLVSTNFSTQMTLIIT